ncbi:fucolectin-like [Crassostrea angulata]|uniref:fucolectin-like n=1 Tax=Magallana angulata TaxID=2784310 RepID=UPI0022B0DDB0|nr:fucolectin-like [Crassostrea angulata]
MNTLQFKTTCLTFSLVFLTCIFCQRLYKTDYQQNNILNRESKDVSLQCLLDETEALLKKKTSDLQNCIDKMDAHNENPCYVMSDIALGKPAKQSSTFNNNIAKYAVDGNRGTDIIEDTCSHTGGGDSNPWWMVDLQAVYYIKTVRILNRGMDKFGIDVSHWLQNVTVTVGVTESNVNTLCGFFPGPGTLAQLLVVIDCPTSTKGKFVRISKPTKALNLCEVDVFGDLL